MITDYRNIFLIILPVLITMHLFVRNCELKPRVASLVIFVLLTLPCLLILGTILYYHSSVCNKDENNKVCKYDFVKKIPTSIYVGCAIIIIGNIYIHNYSSKCY